MTRRRGHKGEIAFQLFSFLDVLLCTIGALIIILTIVIHRARAQASEARARQAAPAPEEVKKQQEALEDARWRQEQLEKTRAQRQENLQNARLALSHLEDHIRRLNERGKELMALLDEVESGKKAKAEDLAASRKELDKLKQEIAKKQEELEKKKKKAAKDEGWYALIPYNGPNGTRRIPIYVECVEEGIIVQPEGVLLGADDFRGEIGPGNPLDAALRAKREYIMKATGGKAAEPYPLIVVRPSGVLAYGAARAAMKSWDDEFGYELISEDKKLDFGERDPLLDQLMQREITLARQRQTILAAAMPRKYQGQEPLRSFANADSPDIQRQRGVTGGGAGGNGGSGRGIGGSDGTGNKARAATGGNGLGGAGAGGNGLGGGNGGSSTQPQGGFVTGLGSQPGGNGGSGAGPYSTSGGPSGQFAAGTAPSGAPGTGGKPGYPGTSGSGVGGSPSGGIVSSGSGTGGSGAGSTGANSTTAASGQRLGAPGQNGSRSGPQGAGSPGGGSYAGGGTGGTSESGSTSSQGGSSPGDASGNSTPGGTSSSASGTSGGTSGGAAGGSAGSLGSPSSQPAGAQGATPSLSLDMGAPGSQPPSSQTTTKKSAKSANSSKAAKGKNWGLPEAQRHVTGVTRPIRLTMQRDKLVLVPERADGRPQEIPLLAEMSAKEIDALISGVHRQMRSWGIAVDGGYWKPALSVDVQPGAEDRFTELKSNLSGSGIEVQRKMR